MSNKIKPRFFEGDIVYARNRWKRWEKVEVRLVTTNWISSDIWHHRYAVKVFQDTQNPSRKDIETFYSVGENHIKLKP